MTRMRMPVLDIPVVWHIGTLDPAGRGKLHRESQEGAGLSVSLCPDAWFQIARLGGNPVQEMSREGALFIHLPSVDGEASAEVERWAVEQGLAERKERWLSWFWDEDLEEWRHLVCADREEALAELPEAGDGEPMGVEGTIGMPEEEGGPPGGLLVSPKSVLALTEAGGSRAMVSDRTGDAFDMAVMFWAEDVLRQHMPDVVGVWWGGDYDPLSYLAPKGAILPCCVAEFSAMERQRGEVPDDEELLDGMPEPREVEVALAFVPAVR